MTQSLSPVSVAPGMALSVSTAESSAFDAIYAEHFSFVWRCLRGLGVAPGSLDDAAQDVFVVVHRRLHTFEGGATLRTWVFGIVRRIAFRYRRGVARKGTAEPLGEEQPAAGPGPLERAQDAEAAEFVSRFLDQLDTRKREVFVLGVLEEMSVPDVAEALGIPLNTAYTRLRRARADFRRALSERLDNS